MRYPMVEHIVIGHKSTLTMAPRKQFTISQKVSMIETLESQRENGKSHRSVARDLGVDASQLRRWKKQVAKLKELLKRMEGRRLNTTAKSVHNGRKSCLNNIEDDLLMFILENRQQGMSVSIRMVTTKASQLDGNFRRKTARAKDQAIRRFVASHGLVHRVHTHQSQRSMNEVRAEAQDWIQQIRARLAGDHRDHRFIINMDQTPIFFSMLPRTTLNASGARTVNVRTSTSSTMRVTAAVTVTADGGLLPSMLIFKGKKGGRIQREFAQYNQGGIYDVQEKAWMDEPIMHEWINKILKPYIQTAPPGIQPVLLLDSYKCHMMATVVQAINDLGVQVEHIPGGCTGLCQPIDIGIGKPLKNRVRDLWENWMIEQGGETVRFTPPSRQTIADWVVSSLNTLPCDLIKRSWRHSPFSYFPMENNQLENIQANGNNPADEINQANDNIPGDLEWVNI